MVECRRKVDTIGVITQALRHDIFGYELNLWPPHRPTIEYESAV